MEHFYELVTIATSNYDMSILPQLWDLSLIQKEDGVVIRALITSKIPVIAKFYQVEEKSSFPEFVRQWEREMLDRECIDLPTECVIYFIKQNNLKGILRVIERDLEEIDWNEALLAAIAAKNITLVEFCYSEFNRSTVLWLPKWRVKPEYILYRNYTIDVILYNIVLKAAATGDTAIIDFFLDVFAENERALGQMFMGVVKAGRKDYVEKLLEFEFIAKGTVLGSSNRRDYPLGNTATIARVNGHIELAEYLLEKGADKEDFLHHLAVDYDRELIKKHIGDVLPRRLAANINKNKDFDMIDFIAKNKPFLLPKLEQYARDPEVKAYIQQYK